MKGVEWNINNNWIFLIKTLNHNKSEVMQVEKRNTKGQSENVKFIYLDFKCL